MHPSSKIFNTRTVLAILLVSILLGFFCNVLFTCIDRLIYPETYYDSVMRYSNEYAVPSELVFAVIKVESNFKSNAVSSAGAIGLMQIMPSTHKWLASKLDEPALTSFLYNADTNIKYGTYYLRYLYSRFGSWEKAIIAYNWGEGNFSEFLEQYGYNEGDYDSIPVRETRNYVKKVMHHWKKYEQLYN